MPTNHAVSGSPKRKVLVNVHYTTVAPSFFAHPQLGVTAETVPDFSTREASLYIASIGFTRGRGKSSNFCVFGSGEWCSGIRTRSYDPFLPSASAHIQ